MIVKWVRLKIRCHKCEVHPAFHVEQQLSGKYCMAPSTEVRSVEHKRAPKLTLQLLLLLFVFHSTLSP
jgi:hypothetical protein